MKMLMVLCCLFFFIGCATNVKYHYISPKKEIAAVVTPGPPTKVEVVEIFEGMSFTDVLKREGIPSETYVPKSKEQIVVYKKIDHYQIYYFKRNKLFLKKDYSFEEMNRIKNNDDYKNKIYKDLEI